MKKIWILKCAAAGAFLVITAAAFGLLATYTHPDRERLFLTPFLNDARGWDIYTMENGIHQRLTTQEVLETEPGKIYYLSRILPQDLEDSGYTFLRLSGYLPCAVFLDDKLLYTTCPDSVFSPEQISFPREYDGLSGQGEAVRCTLPSHFAGRKLTIATTVRNLGYGPSMPGIILSSEELESENAIAITSSELIPAAGFTATALLLMAVWLFAFLQGIYNFQVLLPIAAALLQALSHLRQFEFLSNSYTVLNSPLTQFIPAVSLLLPLIYFFLQIKEKQNRKIFGCILVISAVVAFISPTAELYGGLPVSSAFFTDHWILYGPIIALLVFAVSEAKHGNTELRLFLSGLGITICGIVILYTGSVFGKGYYADMISMVLRSIPEPASFIFLGWCTLILFLLSALTSLHKIFRQMVRTQTELTLQTERSKQLDRQLSAQKDFYDARLGHEKEIRSLRHDMKGHLNTLATLLSDNRVAEAKNYLDGIAEYHNGQISRLFSSNPYVNAVLQNYSAKCLEHHVELVCHIGIGDHVLPATELCLILNNAFENALDASLTLPEADRKIKVQATVRQNMFLLRVSNPFNGSVKIAEGLPVTTKCGKGHGYGLSNIRQAAVRRGGSMEYHIQNGYFVLDVDFPVP